jgi:hypothetical protein
VKVSSNILNSFGADDIAIQVRTGSNAFFLQPLHHAASVEEFAFTTSMRARLQHGSLP